ncbi:uncharacterized protein [Dendropsophus ebraccatus]|uniref:uncharacterized protein isoform X2 n=1 Tax=Dendropsophus ebraccatus TaxID=150705 RepID=UPI0038320602
MEGESAEITESTPPATQVPKEGSSSKTRSKSKECPTCRKRLSSSYNKLLCGSCMNRVLEDQGPSFVRNMKNIIKKEIRASMPFQAQPPTTPAPQLAPIPAPALPLPMSAPAVFPIIDLEQPGPSRSVSHPPSSLGEEEDQSLGTEAEDMGQSGLEVEEVVSEPSPAVDFVDTLIKAVRETMGIEETPEPQTIQDRMFGGLAPKKRPVFPIHQNIKTLIKHEWSNPDRKFFIPAAFKRKYPFDQEESSTWGVAPKIDPPIAKIFKQNALPFEDCASLKDPMDRRAEIYLKKDWEASTAVFKPLVAATSVSRALEVWLSELKEMISKGTPVDELLKPFETLEKAMSFVSEASADALKLSARSAAVSNSARRSMWLKEWKGDVTSRSKLCGVPCEGNLLFGPALDNILEKASDRKKGFPLIPQQSTRPFKGKDTQISFLVDTKESSLQGTSLELRRGCDNHHGRQSSGMGSPCRFPGLPGPMVSRGSQGPTKRERVESNILLLIPGSSTNKKQKCENLIRQQGGSGICQPPGRHKVTTAHEGNSFSFQINRTTLPIPVSTSLKRGRQCKSRFPQPTLSKSGRVGTFTGSFLPDLQTVGNTRNRPVCLSSEQEDSQVLLPLPCRQALSIGCVSPTVEQGPSLCVPSHQTNSESSQEDQTGQGPCHTDSTLLAKKGLVYLAQKDVPDGSLDTTRQSRSPQPGPSLPSTSSQSSHDCLAFERQLLIDRGLSSEVITTLLASRKRVTSMIYLRTWKTFCRFVNKPINVLAAPDIPLILQFLQEGLNKNLRPSTLKVQISALSALYDYKLADHPWIKRFVKAASRLCPTVKSKIPPWDLNLVLNGLTTKPFEPLVESHIKFLSYKLAFLLAITSARRVSEIRAFSIQTPYMTIRDDRVVLSPDPAFLPKVVTDFHRSQEVVLPSFCSTPANEQEISFHSLDVRRAILHYLKVTEEWRLSNNLLISFQGKYRGRAASTQTIARWVKQAIGECYRAKDMITPVGFGAHSTRAVATSWAERAAVSIDQICRAATWSTPHTFFRHYRLQLSSTEDLTFGRRVLQAVVPP